MKGSGCKPRCDEGCGWYEKARRLNPIKGWVFGFLVGTLYGILVAWIMLNDSICSFEQWLVQKF